MKATKLMALGLVGLTTLGLASTANAEDIKSQPTTEASITFGNYVEVPEIDGPDGGTYPPDTQNPGEIQKNGWQLIAPKLITFTNNDDGGAVQNPNADNKYYALKEMVTGAENPYVPLSLKLRFDHDQDKEQGGAKVTAGTITATRTALTSSATNTEVTGNIGIDAVAVRADTTGSLITGASLQGGETSNIPTDTANPLTINFTANEPDSGTAQGLIFLANNGTATDKQSVTQSGIYIKLNDTLKNTKVTSTITWTLNTGTVTGG